MAIEMNRPDSTARDAVLAVIPARLHSSRLPRKLLLRETGRSVLQHTISQVRQAQLVDRVVVATADPEIAADAEAVECAVEWTSPHARCGTERLAEIAGRVPTAGILVNVQGDEPELPAHYVDQLIEMMLRDPSIPIGTLAAPLVDRRHIENPACVKVVADQRGRAMYFSRSPIPYRRDSAPWDKACGAEARVLYWQHLGIYAFRHDFLRRYDQLPSSPIEEAEQLEQLRFLDAGFPIQVGRVPCGTRGIDTPEDYRGFVDRQGTRSAGVSCPPGAPAP